MATVTAASVRPNEDRMFVILAALCAAVAFLAFAGTYWLQLPAGTFVGSPLVHLHALLFSVWTLFFVWQAMLIANRRNMNHRAWGMAGIALASAMVFTGVAVTITGMQSRVVLGFGDGGRAFSIVPMSAMLLFAGFVTAAMVNRRRQDWHKRFMVVASVTLLNAAMARVFFLAVTGGGPGMRPGTRPPLPPEGALIPGLIGDSIILLGMIFDWRARGRVHPAYLWGLGIVVAVQIVRGPIGHTQSWLAFADFLMRFAG